nr:PREDICTED: deoxynucleoside triphosphate triphosphohydrolase SAMHD1-like [Lepisosteus oculatus]
MNSASGQENYQLYKVFNDPIHGHIEMHPLLVKIIDTPQFQRLRFIKQLGPCSFVYPGATHTRFEHSIGVSYLAGRLVEVLQDRQSELKITKKDKLCVQIAGLCHDLGHGPFSHMFDAKFLLRIGKSENEIRHEKTSVKMFEHMLNNNPDLKKAMEDYELDEQDHAFIKNQIDHHSHYGECGRTDKEFLYEIVANKRNGIDVDKWDYLARDSYYLGMQNSFNHERLLKFVRVCEVEGGRQICTRDKEIFNLYDMFNIRFSLHKRALQHRVVNIIVHMITEAFVKAAEHITVQSSNGLYNLSTAVDDMEAYTQLTDNVFHEILNSTSEELKEAREILQRVMRRKLYKFVGETRSKPDAHKKQYAFTGHDVHGLDLDHEKFIVLNTKMDYGMGDNNPIDQVHFYFKNNPTKGVKMDKNQVTNILPINFSEQLVQVYYMGENEDTKSIEKCFVRWCFQNELTKPKDADINCSDLKDKWRP